MISHKYKAIIVHIPKTGGTSIENALNMDKGGGRHLLSIKGKKLYTKWDNYFKFTFVRNPWDRMVSLYHYYKFNNEAQNLHVKGNIPPTFKEFVLDFNNKGKKWYTPFIIPQKEWITDEEGNVMVDYIGRFENYEEDCKRIFTKLGVNVKLRHDRKSPRGYYKDYYDDETIEIVRELFNEDIKFFSYEY